LPAPPLYYKKQNETLGLIWFDAHADMNTPELHSFRQHSRHASRALLGYARRSSRTVAGFAPKLDPEAAAAHVGAREIDPGERETDQRSSAVRFLHDALRSTSEAMERRYG
jgi:arginase